MGRGVLTFSISSAMALASYTPTQMGSTVSLPTSFSSTIGMFETGSIISPRIFISTSMAYLKNAISLVERWASPARQTGETPVSPLTRHLSHQAVREAPCNAHRNVTPGCEFDAFWHGKVHHLNLRRPPDPLSSG